MHLGICLQLHKSSVHHAKLSLAYRRCTDRTDKAVSALNTDASVVKADIKFGIIGGAAYGAHKIAHCRASERHNT